MRAGKDAKLLVTDHGEEISHLVADFSLGDRLSGASEDGKCARNNMTPGFGQAHSPMPIPRRVVP